MLHEELNRPRTAFRRRIGVRTAAMAAVVIVGGMIAPSVALAGPPQHTASRRLAVLKRLPPYYLALVRHGTASGGAIKFEVVVKNTVTGATLATVRPSKPYWTFGAITGAADDRTFVIAAETPPVSGLFSPTRFLLARFHPSTGKVTLSTLPVPKVPLADILTGMALSPNGRKLATAVLTGKHRATARVSVYSLATGSVRSWQSTGTIGDGEYDSTSISWSRSGRLAFDWLGTDSGAWLLDTHAAPGGLLAHSRFVVAESHAGWSFTQDAVLTPDGRRIVAPVWRPTSPPPGVGRFEEFSAATGKPVEILDPVNRSLLALEWTNSTGSLLVAAVPPKPSKQQVFGVVTGNKFIPLPKAPAVSGQTADLAF
jgi:hypothetical protein